METVADERRAAKLAAAERRKHLERIEAHAATILAGIYAGREGYRPEAPILVGPTDRDMLRFAIQTATDLVEWTENELAS